jgi:hypothetical protein
MSPRAAWRLEAFGYVEVYDYVAGKADWVRLGRLEPTDARPAEEAMEPGPTTIRADADFAETAERMRRRGAASLIVSNPDGVLLGVVYAEPSQEQRQ